jgi:hypothetical protein
MSQSDGAPPGTVNSNQRTKGYFDRSRRRLVNRSIEPSNTLLFTTTVRRVVVTPSSFSAYVQYSPRPSRLSLKPGLRLNCGHGPVLLMCVALHARSRIRARSHRAGAGRYTYGVPTRHMEPPAPHGAGMAGWGPPLPVQARAHAAPVEARL